MTFASAFSASTAMAAMRADNRSLDIGYIGAGVAWNPIDTTGNQVSFVFFDNLGNSEKLLAREGIFQDEDQDGKFDLDEIYEGLKGQTVYLEVGTTPGTWLRNLIDAVNEGRDEEEKLWLQCDVESYLSGYTAPNSNEENKVVAVNYNNANIPAGMSSANAQRVDIAVAFSPATTAVINANQDVQVVADNNTLPSSMASPGVWVASDAWLEEDPEVVQRVINALYEGAILRAEDVPGAIRAAEQLCRKPEGSFGEDVCYFSPEEEYVEWFSDPDGAGWEYMRALYEMKKTAIPEGSTPKPFEDAVYFSYFTQAIHTISGGE